MENQLAAPTEDGQPKSATQVVGVVLHQNTKKQSLPSECGHQGCKAEDYTTKCSCRIGGGEKNQFWASIDRQQPAWRNGWFEKSSPGNRTSKDQRPRGEPEEASWVIEENWAAAKPKWTKLSIWWSDLVAFGWPSYFAELSWWILYFVVAGYLPWKNVWLQL